ncbi:c-type cytochrome [Aliibacillus thermotolerans]|uniref:C-type cytochrome n=1 Tax=Aliibacillus thermotolerans TaxID=1834418 RepID=A0ABW0U4X1_9BACI|nr:cytochrome c [Aliibacillus thermotolerans]MDA3130964.1 c-type cytochrome [Aliibacillus thermotolerans]
MKKFLMALAGSAVLVLGACGGGGDDGGDTGGDATGNGGGDGAGETYDAAQAEELYQGNCASCHGENLEGANGPAIAGLDAGHVVDTIENGAAGMPAGLLEGEEAEMVAQWVSEQ